MSAATEPRGQPANSSESIRTVWSGAPPTRVEQLDQDVLRRQGLRPHERASSVGSFSSMPEASSIARSFRSRSSYLSEQELG